MPDVLEPARQLGMLAQTIQSTAHHAPFVYIDRHTFRIGECTISFVAGNIADARADGIVSSANYEMKMRSGVGEALRAKGGDAIEEEAMKGGQHALGECIATKAGTLARQERAPRRERVERGVVRRPLHAARAPPRRRARRALARLPRARHRRRARHARDVRERDDELAQVAPPARRHAPAPRADRPRRRGRSSAIFREVAEEALRDGDRRAAIDVGLPAEERVVDSKSATCLDVNESTDVQSRRGSGDRGRRRPR